MSSRVLKRGLRRHNTCEIPFVRYTVGRDGGQEHRGKSDMCTSCYIPQNPGKSTFRYSAEP